MQFSRIVEDINRNNIGLDLDLVERLKTDGQLAEKVDKGLLVLLGYFKNQNIPARVGLQYLLDKATYGSYQDSVVHLFRSRWFDTLHYIDIYENKALSADERLRAKPVLKKRGLV